MKAATFYTYPLLVTYGCLGHRNSQLTMPNLGGETIAVAGNNSGRHSTDPSQDAAGPPG